MSPSLEEIEALTIPIPDSFQGFDPRGELEIYSSNLPHWNQVGASYAVTFRTSDSVPKEVIAEIKDQTAIWEERIKNCRPGEEFEKAKLGFETFRRENRRLIDHELDRCHGACLLKEAKNQEWVTEALFYFNGARYEVFAFAIMPNHVHVVVFPFEGHSLATILQSWKTFTSRRIDWNGKSFWQRESHDRIILDEDHFTNAVKYALANPAKANLPSSHAKVWAKDVWPTT